MKRLTTNDKPLTSPLNRSKNKGYFFSVSHWAGLRHNWILEDKLYTCFSFIITIFIALNFQVFSLHHLSPSEKVKHKSNLSRFYIK